MLGIFVAGSVRVLTALRRSSDLSRMHYQAINIAKDRLERISAFDFRQLDSANEPPNVLPGGKFRRTTEISDVFLDPSTNPPLIVATNRPTGLKQISVTVEVLNPRTRRFDGTGHNLQSMMADIVEMP